MKNYSNSYISRVNKLLILKFFFLNLYRFCEFRSIKITKHIFYKLIRHIVNNNYTHQSKKKSIFLSIFLFDKTKIKRFRWVLVVCSSTSVLSKLIPSNSWWNSYRKTAWKWKLFQNGLYQRQHFEEKWEGRGG